MAVRLATFSIAARCPRTGRPKRGAPESVAQMPSTPPPLRPGGGGAP